MFGQDDQQQNKRAAGMDILQMATRGVAHAHVYETGVIKVHRVDWFSGVCEGCQLYLPKASYTVLYQMVEATCFRD